jgi:hypothetical protein
MLAHQPSDLYPHSGVTLKCVISSSIISTSNFDAQPLAVLAVPAKEVAPPDIFPTENEMPVYGATAAKIVTIF